MYFNNQNDAENNLNIAFSTEAEDPVDSLRKFTVPTISQGEEKVDRLLTLLRQSMKEKEEMIKEKEAELECPVCLETAEGEIFSCVQQHLICGECRPLVVECPLCRETFPPYLLRHRYAIRSLGELRTLQQELRHLTEELEAMGLQG